MRFLRSLVPLFLASAALAASAEPLPPHLEPVARDAVSYLSSLYGLPPFPSSAIPPVEWVPRGGKASAHWDGLPEWAAGAATPADGRIVLFEGRSSAFPFGDSAQTLRHEISHVLLRRAAAVPVPRWLDEGLALRVSGEWESEMSALSLLSGRASRISLEGIERDFAGGESQARRSYELARGFVADLFPGPQELTSFLFELRQRKSFAETFLLRFGRTPEEKFDAYLRDVPVFLRVLALAGSDGALFGLAAGILVPLGFLLTRRRRKAQLERLGPLPDPAAPPRSFRENVLFPLPGSEPEGRLPIAAPGPRAAVGGGGDERLEDDDRPDEDDDWEEVEEPDPDDDDGEGDDDDWEDVDEEELAAEYEDLEEEDLEPEGDDGEEDDSEYEDDDPVPQNRGGNGTGQGKTRR